jgi:hypothetical protein
MQHLVRHTMSYAFPENVIQINPFSSDIGLYVTGGVGYCGSGSNSECSASSLVHVSPMLCPNPKARLACRMLSSSLSAPSAIDVHGLLLSLCATQLRLVSTESLMPTGMCHVWLITWCPPALPWEHGCCAPQPNAPPGNLSSE